MPLGGSLETPHLSLPTQLEGLHSVIQINKSEWLQQMFCRTYAEVRNQPIRGLMIILQEIKRLLSGHDECCGSLSGRKKREDFMNERRTTLCIKSLSYMTLSFKITKQGPTVPFDNKKINFNAALKLRRHMSPKSLKVDENVFATNVTQLLIRPP